MLSASVRCIGGFQLRRGASRDSILRQRRRDGTCSLVAPSAAATEAVYALASVAAASGTLLLASSWNHSREGGGEDDQLLAARGSDDASTSDSFSSSSSKTQTPPAPPPSTRLLYVSLSIVSFLPFINFAAFACLAATESFKNGGEKGEEEDKEEKKNRLLSALLSPSALAGFSIFYSLPFLLVALTTTESGSVGSELSVFAMESLVLGVLHLQAIRLAGERREEEKRERSAAAAAPAAAAAADEDGEEEQASALLFASLAASELERFDARLGLKTAKASRLRELAQAAGVLGSKGRRKGKKEEETNGVASAPVARTKASLAAALAAAAALEGTRKTAEDGGHSSSCLDFETRDWLISELAQEAREPLLEKKKAKRRTGRGRGAAAVRAQLEALDDEEQGCKG